MMLYVLSATAKLQADNPEVAFSIHVDDISITRTGQATEVREGLVKACAEAMEEFENKLELPFAKPKTFIIASQERLAKDIAGDLGLRGN